MKFFVCVVAFALVAAASAKGATDEKKREVNKKCIAEAKVDTALLDKASTGDFSDDAAFKKYLLCTHKEFEGFNADGTIKVRTIEKLLDFFTDKTQAEAAQKECFVDQKTSEDTALFVTKCFYKYLPEMAAKNFKLY